MKTQISFLSVSPVGLKYIASVVNDNQDELYCITVRDRAPEHQRAQCTQFLHVFYGLPHIETEDLYTEKQLRIPTIYTFYPF